MLLGRQADDDLSAAIARSIADPGRDAAIDAALADGLRANRIAYAGGIIGGALVVGGIAALLQGARLRARAVPTAGGVGLAWRF
ncbi:MAG: hypothetical protein H6710_00490 [Myxococcales bacterium]|nr:hypothetical protein [Myxococcales bacterium]